MAPNCTYTGTIRLSGNINLSPGLYYFKSAQLTLHSSAVITGTGVQIYLDAASNIDLSGGASLNLKAPETGATAGILIFGARGATGGQIHLGGSSNVSLNGTLYTPASTLHLRGNATFTQDGRTGTIITRLLRVTGSSDFIVNGFGTAGVQAKSTIVRSSLVR